ncbi:hypothetical protein PC121_g8980 [Phytophthora cactorum]|nr:hypothetical protein PC120_g15789 [Phytophthora cactorum]KAG3072265.1 hypothetical protein PC121_g8980 [Phytophthora cactorum]KAG4048758.1 hypothetical protein PC123_g15935 [Phytophthora cactorum]
MLECEYREFHREMLSQDELLAAVVREHAILTEHVEAKYPATFLPLTHQM